MRSLQARLGRGSPLCAKLRESIASQIMFLSASLWLSTIHTIVKRFRESGEISVRKGQGRKPLLNAHQVLRRYCLRNRALVPTACVIWIYVKVPLMQKLMLEFWRDICCCQHNDFSQELQCLFQQENARTHSAQVTTAWLCGIECVCLVGLPPVCLLLKMYAASWRQRRPRTVQLNSSSLVYTKNGQNMHLQNCNN